MSRATINGLALLVLALSGAATAIASPQATLRMYNKCSGGGLSCYCSGACVASGDGCHCL